MQLENGTTFSLDYDYRTVTLIGGQVIINVHSPYACAGRNCCIHYPSHHHMNTWPQNWRAYPKVMERVCSHGIGHPDPDDVSYHYSRGNGWAIYHACCDFRCCDPTIWEDIIDD